MKQLFFFLIIISLQFSCSEESNNESTSQKNIEPKSNNNKAPTNQASADMEKSLEGLGQLLNLGNENQAESSPEKDALEKLMQMSGTLEKDGTGSLETMLSTKAILDMLEASGVSREEMEKLISNPDSLKILAQNARKERAAERYEKEVTASKGKISKKQLASKNTPTGVSLEEAILIVQAESGVEATMETLQKIDSLAGTNIMEQMDIKKANQLMTEVERRNEVKASPQEKEEMTALRKLSGQMHSDKEAKELYTKLEQMEKDIESGDLKVSPQYQRTISHQKKIVKIFRNDIIRKAKTAKRKFQKLNPDLYFGEEIGATYLGERRQMVFLPLGHLSFADKVVKVKHPKLLTQQVNNALGEPNVIRGFRHEEPTGIYSLGLGGKLTVQFIDNALTNVNGPDLFIFEIGTVEPTDLEISKDGKTWIHVGKIDGGVAEVDIEDFVKQGELFYYVRLTDLKTPTSLPGADVDAIAAIGAAMRLNLDSKVLFDSGKSVLKPEGKNAIKKLANRIEILKSGSVIVEGHTDNVGSDVTNQKLSLARAKSVSAELKKLIPSRKFKWKEKGLGESKPLVENNSDSNRSKNRRVEILVLPN